MDALIRDTVFAGLTDIEFLQAVAAEIKRREMAGVVYMLALDERGTRESYAASAVPMSLQHLSMSEIMKVMWMHSSCMPKETLVTPKKDGDDWSQ